MFEFLYKIQTFQNNKIKKPQNLPGMFKLKKLILCKSYKNNLFSKKSLSYKQQNFFSLDQCQTASTYFFKSKQELKR